jgi:hypothetical protein
MNSKFAMLIAWILLPACAVEVGNPRPDENATGKVKISVGSADGIGKSLRMKLSAVELSSGSNQQKAYAVQPTSAEADLLAANDDPTFIAEIAGVEPGEYDTIVLGLSGDQALQFTDDQGEATDLDISTIDGRQLVFDAAITVQAGATEEAVAVLDLRRSIHRIDDGKRRFKFEPIGMVHHRRPGLSFSGRTDFPGAKYACAYLFAPPRPPRHPSELPPPPPLHIGPMPAPKSGEAALAQAPHSGRPPHRVNVRGRPFFAEGAAVVKDSDAECSQAFERVPVVDGQYRFERLMPGIYDIRVFAVSDGASSFTDVAAGVRIEPEPRTR